VISDEEARANLEGYKKAYAELSDYNRALVDCGYLSWIGNGEFSRASPLSGQKTMPEGCPERSEFE
jgi:hypothetical protein